MPETLYLADCLPQKYRDVFDQITHACDEIGQPWAFIPHTRDIWVRDFMPVVLPGGKLLEYRYDPDYLQGDTKGRRGKKSYPDIICDAMKLPTVKSDLVLDGGNVIRQGNTLIMADKVVRENRRHYNKTQLIAALKEQFGVDKLVLIPKDKKDPYGHADSMLRFVDENTVLVNYYYDDDKDLIAQLEKAGLRIKFLQFSNIDYKQDHLWPYLNFVQTDKLMLYTAIEEHYDQEAKEQFERYFPKYKNRMRGIKMPEIIEEGGALHCISWVL